MFLMTEIVVFVVAVLCPVVGGSCCAARDATHAIQAATRDTHITEGTISRHHSTVTSGAQLPQTAYRHEPPSLMGLMVLVVVLL